MKISEAQYAPIFVKGATASYTEFYSNFAGDSDSPAPQRNPNVVDNVGVPNFASMKGGVAVGQPSLSDESDNGEKIRNYWSTKTQETMDPQVKVAPVAKAPPNYAIFEDEN